MGQLLLAYVINPQRFKKQCWVWLCNTRTS